MRVALLPTGEAEFRGLPRALKALFPSHDFVCEGRAPERPHFGFTSSVVDPARAAQRGSKLRQMIDLVAALLSSGSRGRYDLVFILEDLELANALQPQRVIEAVRAAVHAHLAEPRIDNARNPLPDALRRRASFHLAVPMLESWFFGDLACLAQAPEPPQELAPKLVASCDPEHFLTDDPHYEADDGSACTDSESARWSRLDALARPAHPKSYLEWLCKAPGARRCTSYREVVGGVRCLATMDWFNVLAHPSRFQYLRAFVADLADGLGETPVALVPEHLEAPLTRRRHDPSGPLLRNL